jgi:hypothetical protein
MHRKLCIGSTINNGVVVNVCGRGRGKASSSVDGEESKYYAGRHFVKRMG